MYVQIDVSKKKIIYTYLVWSCVCVLLSVCFWFGGKSAAHCHMPLFLAILALSRFCRRTVTPSPTALPPIGTRADKTNRMRSIWIVNISAFMKRVLSPVRQVETPHIPTCIAIARSWHLGHFERTSDSRSECLGGTRYINTLIFAICCWPQQWQIYLHSIQYNYRERTRVRWR